MLVRVNVPERRTKQIASVFERFNMSGARAPLVTGVDMGKRKQVNAGPSWLGKHEVHGNKTAVACANPCCKRVVFYAGGKRWD